MQTDEIAGLNARLTTRETEETALTADLNAVTTALGTGSPVTEFRTVPSTRHGSCAAG